ncbi:MAG: ABC transporter ATP-binding protein [Peptostreptococcaceae bacterium]
MVHTVWKFIKDSVRLSPLFFTCNIVFIFVFRCLQLCMDLSLKFATDTLLIADSKVEVIIPFLLFFLAMMLGGNTGNVNNFLVTLFTRNSMKHFTKQFMRRSYCEKQDSFCDDKFYNEYEFVKNNITNTSQISVTIFNNLLSAIISLIITLMAITYFSPLILIIILPISIFMVSINRYIVKKRIMLDQTYIKQERKAEYFRKLLSGRDTAKEVRIFGLKDMFWEKWSLSYEEFSRAKYTFEQKARWISNIPMLLENILSAALTILFLIQVKEGVLSVGEFVLMYRMMWRLTGGITHIIKIITSDFLQNYQYATRYEEFIGNKDDRNTATEESSIDTFEMLELKNVSYTYPSQKINAIDGVDFSIKKGEIVAILGYNGSGKSTLSKIMCGLLEGYKGSISINGIDYSKMDRFNLYKYFGIAFQEFTRYSMTLRENVAIGMIEKASDNNLIQKAFEKANLKEIIELLPDGAETMLGKEYHSAGQDLSGGQWQRIILSRAYMGESPFLILDEPTASIDPLQEMKMLENFKKVIKGQTAVLISHRIGFARLSDRICMMSKGKIVEEGTHEELLELKGLYYQLYMSQKDLYGE